MNPFSRLLARRLTPSIRTQLLFWLVIPILLLLLVGAALSYGLAIRMCTEAYDKALVGSVYSIARCVEHKGNKTIVDVPPAALAILRDDVSDKVYYQVLDKNCKLIAGDANMPPIQRTEDLIENSSDCNDGTINGEQVRIATVSVPDPANPKSVNYVQVGETLHQRESIADQVLIGIIVPQFGILALSAFLVWFGVRRGLLPLNNVRDAVARRSPIDLSPLALGDVPKEVRPLVKAINELLDRLQQDLQAQRRFVANAAHQLRTPIAGLKTQTEVALRQKDPIEIEHALGLIHTGAERAARLANQLLALARAEPGATDPKLWREIDLRAIGRNACKEFVPEAIARGIDLGFEGDEAVYVLGDEASLHELTCNLVHNAVQYTPSGGAVTVRVESCAGTASDSGLLIVEDNGPGIPFEERERVFERFYRLIDRRVSGSGLGLAIVREIAHLHNAQVSLADGPNSSGARVTVSFAARLAPNVKPAAVGVGSVRSPHNFIGETPMSSGLRR